MIEKKITQLATQTESLVDRLYHLADQIEHQELTDVLAEMKERIAAAFTFVIVGEVKAGKSSFVNALLESEKEICKVAPNPMTDTIQLITYGEEERTETVNPHYKRIFLPIEILKEIAIVDTPGTNTIVEHHQEITERFIPHSDLIVFVFEAKNPYRQSAWEFFDYINEEWRRKIIFVLQQKDLMSPADLEINIKGVVDHAIKKGIAHPNVFAVSAKQELEGLQNESGFSPLRKYISENITQGKAPFLKLKNIHNTSEAIIDKIGESVQLRMKQWESDKAFRESITTLLEEQELKTAKQTEVLSENLIAAYDRITSEKRADLADGLGFFKVLKRSFSSVFGSEDNLKTWLEQQAKDFEYKLNTSLKDKLNAGILDIADSIQTMGKLVHARIKDSKTILKDSDEIFADIAEKRAHVLSDLQQSFSDFMKKSENFYDEQLASESGRVNPTVATSSGIAIVGVILTAVANGAVFDITGGILTTLGVLFAGVTLGIQKNKVLRGFDKEIKEGRNKLTFEVRERLNAYTRRIKNRIDDNFHQFDLLLKHEESVLGDLNREIKDLSEQIVVVKNNTDIGLQSKTK